MQMLLEMESNAHVQISLNRKLVFKDAARREAAYVVSVAS